MPTFLVLLPAARLERFEFLAQLGQAGARDAPVGLELGLARAERADAAALAFQVRPKAREAWDQVLELGDLHLELGLAGAGLPCEDVQDQARTIQDHAARELLQALGLAGGKVVVEDDLLDVLALAQFGELAHLSAAQEGGGIEVLAVLHQLAGHLRTRRIGQTREFRQVLGGGFGVLLASADAHEHDPLHFLPVTSPSRFRGREVHSHSMVPGGLWVQS